ncbi:hypothetical protein [Janthinobacterium sp. RB2P8]|uniref:hypothetical protein n=1 Tax=Janthinobacterium sp. RB2P8 TaxID=3424191 RepID=UPI003F296243
MLSLRAGAAIAISIGAGKMLATIVSAQITLTMMPGLPGMERQDPAGYRKFRKGMKYFLKLTLHVK